MKVFLRTLVILFAALVISGSAIGISGLSASSSTGTDNAAIQASRPARPEGDGPEGEHGGVSLMGLGTVGIQLVKVSLIVAPFAIVGSWQKRRKLAPLEQ